MRGRKPKPTAVKRAEGNPGKRPLPENEPQFPTGELRPPPELSDDAQKEWLRLVPILQEMGLATKADFAALVGYCSAFGRFVAAEREIKKIEKMVVKSPVGYPMINPYLSISNKSLELCKKFLVEFGLTPSSRVSLATKTTDEKKELDEFTAYRLAAEKRRQQRRGRKKKEEENADAKVKVNRSKKTGA